jgi:hypothetical protein
MMGSVSNKRNKTRIIELVACGLTDLLAIREQINSIRVLGVKLAPPVE